MLIYRRDSFRVCQGEKIDSLILEVWRDLHRYEPYVVQVYHSHDHILLYGQPDQRTHQPNGYKSRKIRVLRHERCDWLRRNLASRDHQELGPS